MIYSLKYTDDMPKENGGYAKFWFIRLRPKYKNDQDILEHEKEHVRQWWHLLLLHPVLYLCSKKYRQWSEVSAYRVQLQYPPASLDVEYYRDMYAGWLSDPSKVTGYGLTLTKEEAVRLLS
jgi:hypothetical protein